MKRFLKPAWYISKCLVLILVCQILVDFSIKGSLGLSLDIDLIKYNLLLSFIGGWSANLSAFIYLVRSASGDTEKLKHLEKEVIILYSCFEYVYRIIMFLNDDYSLSNTFPMPYVVLVQYVLFRGCFTIASHPFFQKKPKEVETHTLSDIC